jgi:hypothetical protein
MRRRELGYRATRKRFSALTSWRRCPFVRGRAEALEPFEMLETAVAKPVEPRSSCPPTAPPRILARGDPIIGEPLF